MKKPTYLSCLLGLLLLPACNSSNQELTQSPKKQQSSVDVLVFHNGDIITVDDNTKFSISQKEKYAVLVEGDTIKQIAPKVKIDYIIDQKYANSNNYNVQYLNLDGKTLMPGFIEPHAHLQLTAQAGSVKNLMPCLPNKYQSQLYDDYGWFYYPKDENGKSPTCYLYLHDAIASVTNEEQDSGNWLLGNGLDPSRMLWEAPSEEHPYKLNDNRDFLKFPMNYLLNKDDEEITNNPVFIFDQSGHLAYANMRAFKDTGFCNAKISADQIKSLSKEAQAMVDNAYQTIDQSITLECEGTKDEMMANQEVLKQLCFDDGSVGIAENDQGKWQYSGLISEASAYMIFANAMLSSNNSKQTNIRNMIKHAPDASLNSGCPLANSHAAPGTISPDEHKKLMTTMKYILNTSSQQGVTTFVEGGTTNEMAANYINLVVNDEADTRIRSLYDWREVNKNTTRISMNDKTYKGMFSAEGIKLWSDGSTQGCTANLMDEYSEDGLCEVNPDGHTDYNQEQIQNNLQNLADCGWYFNIHANGDQAITDSAGALINMYDSSRQNVSDCKDNLNDMNYSQLHHTIIHSTVNQNGDSRLNINKEIPLNDKAKECLKQANGNSIVETYCIARNYLPNLSSSHLAGHIAYWGESMKNELGDNRGNNIAPMGDESKAQIPFSLHSDLSISPLYPLWFIEQAVTRETWQYPNLSDSDAHVLGSKQKISVEDAIKAVTIVPAQQHNIGDKLGSIREGKLADLIVLDKNPLDFGSDGEYKSTEIHTINVECSFISGKEVDWYNLPLLQDNIEQKETSNCQTSPERLSQL
ncbi:amidohydrolase family protein [Ferrimonas aestuarii]|nr:amidohydrolase family protein [Ferrimonas aestuarii]